MQAITKIAIHMTAMEEVKARASMFLLELSGNKITRVIIKLINWNVRNGKKKYSSVICKEFFLTKYLSTNIHNLLEKDIHISNVNSEIQEAIRKIS